MSDMYRPSSFVQLVFLFFIAIIVSMPEGLVPGTVRLARGAWDWVRALGGAGTVRTVGDRGR